MKHKTIKALFEAKSNLLGAWVSTNDEDLQTKLFKLYDDVNDILATHGIDPYSYTVDTTRVELVASLKVLGWSMLPSRELERRD